MKKLLLAICLLSSVTSRSQEVMGIKVDGLRTDVVNKFKAKGFKVTGTPSEKAVTMEGVVNGNKYEVVVVNTPTTKKVWKIALYLSKQTDWYDIKATYEKYYNMLVEKYGQPNSFYTGFSSPYYEGDGYEMSAVGLGKCNYTAFWDFVYIEISEFKQVYLSYENAVNVELNKIENKNIDNKNF